MLEHGIKPEIEVFDLAMLYRAADMAAQGLLQPPLHVQFVLGVRNALPAHRDILEFELEKLQELLPDATWVAAGIGRSQFEVNRWCLELGGHMRTGLEDNVRLDANTLAPSNAALVARATHLCEEYDRHPASTTEARAILGLEDPS
jgi:uncharacterized protein (DUF849 family)